MLVLSIFFKHLSILIYRRYRIIILNFIYLIDVKAQAHWYNLMDYIALKASSICKYLWRETLDWNIVGHTTHCINCDLMSSCFVFNKPLFSVCVPQHWMSPNCIHSWCILVLYTTHWNFIRANKKNPTIHFLEVSHEIKEAPFCFLSELAAGDKPGLILL